MSRRVSAGLAACAVHPSRTARQRRPHQLGVRLADDGSEGVARCDSQLLLARLASYEAMPNTVLHEEKMSTSLAQMCCVCSTLAMQLALQYEQRGEALAGSSQYPRVITATWLYRDAMVVACAAGWQHCCRLHVRGGEQHGHRRAGGPAGPGRAHAVVPRCPCRHPGQLARHRARGLRSSQRPRRGLARACSSVLSSHHHPAKAFGRLLVLRVGRCYSVST